MIMKGLEGVITRVYTKHDLGIPDIIMGRDIDRKRREYHCFNIEEGLEGVKFYHYKLRD